MAPVIRDGDLLVFELSCILKEIRQVGGDVQDVLDAKLLQHVQVGGVLGTPQIEEGKIPQGRRLTSPQWLPSESVALLGSRSRSDSNVRGGVGADPQAPEPQYWQRWRAAATRAAQISLAVVGRTRLELTEPPARRRKTIM